MFGRFYDRWDRELQEENIDADSYACRLLADTLNRAAVLRGAQEAYAHAGATEEGCEGFAAAVHAFLDDVEEASIRARRARVLSITEGFLDSFCGPSDEELAELGGALVPKPTAYDRRKPQEVSP